MSLHMVTTIRDGGNSAEDDIDEITALPAKHMQGKSRLGEQPSQQSL